MTENDWRKRFAPNGYYKVTQRLSFETVERACEPRDILTLAIDNAEQMIESKCPYLFDPNKRELRLTVWPKDIGENINHLDPLRPRLGIEIEVRQPVL